MPEIVKKRPLGHPKSKTKFTNYLIYNTLEKSTFSNVENRKNVVAKEIALLCIVIFEKIEFQR